MEDSGVAIRLKALIEALGLSDSQFADRSSISRPTLSLLLSGKNKKISDIFLSQIHEAFPKVSILWLLFGEGDMFLSQKSDSQDPESKGESSLFSSQSFTGDEELNLVNLKQIEKVVQEVVNKSFTDSIGEMENIMKKNLTVQTPRKVSKITVYYDDSTFETFIPEHI